MERQFQEKAFRDLQEDERIKRLERQLKLTKLRRQHGSQLRSSPHMSISGISSIHSDNLSSDFSFSCPSVASGGAGSVIISSSNNLRKSMARNLKTVAGSSSSALERITNCPNIDEDRAMMPPPSAAVNSRQPQADINPKPEAQVVYSTPKTTIAQNFDNQTHSKHSSLESSLLENSNASETARSNNHNEYPKKRTIDFRNWIVRLNEHGQIIIRGRIESEKPTRSKPVKRRLAADMVLSILNRRYRLIGDIYDVREELPEYIRGKFFNGFPTDWENVRQIWQGYVASGYNLRFRWPTPMADSDDDLRSDITDLTVANLRNSRSKLVPVAALSPPQETEIVVTINGEKKTRYSPRHVERSDNISSIHSVANKNPVDRTEISPLDKSYKINAEIIETGGVGDNLSADCNKSASKSAPNDKTQASKYEDFVPRRKIDLIIDNLMNKNCSKEYIDKFIIAINCFNELFTILPINNSQTLTPEENVFLNHNSNSQIMASSNQINGTTERIETVRNFDCSRTQAAKNYSKSNSFSLESSAELEEEKEDSPSENDTHYRNQSAISRRTKENQKSPTMSRGRNMERYNQTRKTNEKHNSRAVSIKTRTETHQVVTVDQINNLVGDGAAEGVCDSDVSILDVPLAQHTKPRILSIKNIRDTPSRKNQKREPLRRDFSFCNSNENYRSKENLSTSGRDVNINSNQTIVDSSSVVGTAAAAAARDRVEQSSIPLSKVKTDIHNNTKKDSTPNKSAMSSRSRHKENKIETDHPTSEWAGSDSENVSLRMSSRGRRILPALDYWNGERVTLKGQELIYSPGTNHSISSLRNHSLLKNSSKSPNNTVLSESSLKPVVQSVRERSQTTGKILSDISGNRDDNDNRPRASDRRITRELTNKREGTTLTNKKKSRIRSENLNTSSEEETTQVKRKQKRRRVY